METTRGHVKYHRKKVGDVIYKYIRIFNKFNPKNKENREKANQTLITKYPAPKTRKRCSKNNKPKK